MQDSKESVEAGPDHTTGRTPVTSMQSAPLRADPLFRTPLKSAALITRSIELRRGRRCRCDRLAAMTYNNPVESSSHERVAVAILRFRWSFF